MNPGEAARFLTERVQGEGVTLEGDEANAVRDLAHELGYLPLALEQAAAYVAAQGVRFRIYLNLFRKRSIDHIEQSTPEAGDYGKTLGTTWAISFAEVERVRPASADLLRLCAFVAPDNIPVEVVGATVIVGKVSTIATHFGTLDDVDEIEDAFARLLEPLTRYSLATVNPETATFSLHRLVQAVTRWQMPADTRTLWTTNALEALNRAFPNKFDFNNWSTCKRLVSCIMIVKDYVNMPTRYITVIVLLTKVANYLEGQGRYIESIDFTNVLLEIQEKAPSTNIDIATTTSNLANLFMLKGDNGDGEKTANLLDKAYRLLTPLTGWTASIAMAIHYDRMGIFDYRQGIKNNNELDCLKAETYYQMALDILRKLQDSSLKNQEVYTCVSRQQVYTHANLGILYMKQGNYVKAEKYYLVAVVIAEHIKKEDARVLIAECKKNLAELKMKQKQYEEAHNLLEEALQLYNDVYPDKNHRIASIHGRRAKLYREQREYNKEKNCLIEAIKIEKEIINNGYQQRRDYLDNWEQELINCNQKLNETL